MKKSFMLGSVLLITGMILGTGCAKTDSTTKVSEETAAAKVGAEQKNEITVNATLSGKALDCESIAKAYAGEVTYTGEKTVTVAGTDIDCFVFAGGENSYYVSPGYDYIVKIEYGDDTKISEAEKIAGDVMDIKYELKTKDESAGYLHLAEYDGDTETGTYAIFTADADDTLTTATFFENDSYNPDAETIGEDKALEIGSKAIKDKLMTREDLNVKLDDAASVKAETRLGKAVYTVTMKGVLETDIEAEITATVNAVTGEVIEIASNLDL